MTSPSREYDEKRDFIRMKVDSPMRIEVEGHPSIACTCHDLSSTGVRFVLEHEMTKGEEARIIIPSNRHQLPPLHAIIKILRKEESTKGYVYGARIVSILDGPNNRR